MHDRVKQDVRARDDEAAALSDALDLETARGRKLQELIDAHGGAAVLPPPSPPSPGRADSGPAVVVDSADGERICVWVVTCLDIEIAQDIREGGEAECLDCTVCVVVQIAEHMCGLGHPLNHVRAHALKVLIRTRALEQAMLPGWLVPV